VLNEHDRDAEHNTVAAFVGTIVAGAPLASLPAPTPSWP
jgi:hypothetical protein